MQQLRAATGGGWWSYYGNSASGVGGALPTSIPHSWYLLFNIEKQGEISKSKHEFLQRTNVIDLSGALVWHQ